MAFIVTGRFSFQLEIVQWKITKLEACKVEGGRWKGNLLRVASGGLRVTINTRPDTATGYRRGAENAEGLLVERGRREGAEGD